MLSTLLTLGLLEIGFRVAGYQPLYAVYSEPSEFWQRDDQLGWSFEPNSSGRYVGPRPFPIQYRTPIRINSLGLRGEELADVPRRTTRIAILGDSLVAAFEVPLRSTYAHLVEEQLQRRDHDVQVVNAGVQGYGTDQAYLLYRDRIAQLDADIVVYHTSSNDPDDNITLHRVRRPFGKPAFALEDDAELRLVGSPVPEYDFCSGYALDAGFDKRRTDTTRSRVACWLQSRLADHSALFSFVTSTLQRNPQLLQRLYGLGAPAGRPARAPQHADDVTAELIERLSAEVTAEGATFVLMGQSSDLDPLDLTEVTGRIVRLDEALGANPGDEVRIPIDGHYNEKGHRLVADLLTDELGEILQR